ELFALVVAGGAAGALIGGRLGDRGLGRRVRGAAIALAVVAMLLAGAGAGSLILLAVAAVLLDLAVQTNQVLSQRDVYGLRPDASARLNTVYMTTVFIGGAAASAVSGVLTATAGWTAATLFGAALAGLAGGVGGWGLLRGGGPRTADSSYQSVGSLWITVPGERAPSATRNAARAGDRGASGPARRCWPQTAAWC